MSARPGAALACSRSSRLGRRRAPSLAHLPGPRGAAFVRLMLHFVRDSLGALEASQARYGDVVAYHWPISTVILYDPAAIRHVLLDNQANYEKGAQTEELGVLMGAGLVTNNDRASWARRRAIVNRALSASAVREMVPALSRVIGEEVSALDVGAERVVDLVEPMRRLSFRIACQVLLGDAITGDEAAMIDEAVLLGSHVVHRHMFSLLRLPYWVPLLSHLRLARARRRIDAVMMRLIKRARRDAPGDSGGAGILSRLVRAGSADSETRGRVGGGHARSSERALDDGEIRDEVVTLLIAGYETTANALAWTLSLLARHPEAQAAVRAEAAQPGAVDLRALKTTHRYTAAVISESLRLYPTIPMSSRRALLDDQIGAIHIPAGANVVVPTWNVQRDPRQWEEATRFCPERFMQDSAQSQSVPPEPMAAAGGCPARDPRRSRTDCHSSYAPFSRGERGCVGRTFALVEIANAILAMVERFELEAPAEVMPRAVSEVSLRPEHGAPVRLRRRPA